METPDWTLLGKYLSGESNPDETKRVEAWASGSKKNISELERQKLLLKRTDDFYQLKNFNAEKGWDRIRPHLKATASPEERTPFKKPATASFFKYAAIIVFTILFVSAGYFLLRRPANTEYSEIVTTGQQVITGLVLSDGTRVTLNKESRLEYPAKFDPDQREVFVSGESFFDVQPEAGRPFVINAGEVKIRVLGTSFNIQAYPEEKSVEITVHSGSVQVACPLWKEEVIPDSILLNAGEKAIVFTEEQKVEKLINNDPNYLAWINHTLHFEKTPLPEVISTVYKLYRIPVQLEGEELKELKLSATFQDKSASFILDAIRLTFDLELKQESGTYILSEKKVATIQIPQS